MMARRPKGPKLLADAIAVAGILKRDAAAKASLKPSELSHLLHGRREPTGQQAAKIKDAFGVPMRAWYP